MPYRLCVFTLFAIALIACQSAKTPEPVPIVPPPESRAVNPDLGGFPWIFELEETSAFPGYQGFYLGRDGRLLLINFPDAIGDRWKIQGDLLSLSFLQGAPELMNTALTHKFYIIVEGAENDPPRHIRLIPESSSDSMGISLTRGSAEIDLVENHWLLKTLAGSEDVNWPINADIYMLILPDKNGLNILGHGGVNRFRGDIELEDGVLRVGSLTSTLMSGPYLNFEDRYTSALMSVNRYVQVDFNLFLYTDTTAVAAFKALMFN